MRLLVRNRGSCRHRPSRLRPLCAAWLVLACLCGRPVAAVAAESEVTSVDEPVLFEPPATQDPIAGESLRSEGFRTQYLEESLTHPDPRQQAEIEAMVERAVAERLAGIPRPRYIPATDIAPPKGLLLHANDPRRGDFPFAMALGGFMQLRWFEFARDNTEWTDAAGVTRPINNINTFNINRFLLSFNGHVADERLLYNFALFGTTNAGVRSGIVPIGLAGWKFSDAATVGGGVTIVPVSREWVQTNPWTIGVDRSLANTFFRPGFSPGVQSTGNLLDGTVHYIAGAWNAIDGGTTGVLRRGTAMAWVGNIWWEPFGPFGLGGSDMEIHEEPVIRLGTSGGYAPTYSPPLALPGNNPENTIVRLSDGTPLSAVDALGPGTRVERYLYRLMTVDAAWKWRGVGITFEYYFRLLDSFEGTGDFDRTSIYDNGGLAYLSWCFVPRTYEVYARSSALTGPYGTGQEYGGGFNWYLRESRQARLTLEALSINRSAADNLIYPYRAGATGTAIQTQLIVVF